MSKKTFKRDSAARGAGQAFAAVVMALAVAVGGFGTTAVYLSQPTGLTVEPSVQLVTDAEDPASFVAEEEAASEEPAASSGQTVTVTVPAEAVEAPQQTPAAPAEPEAPAAEESAEAAAAPTEPAPAAAENTETAAAPTEPAQAEPVTDDGALDEENSMFPLLAQETDALAAEDPELPPADENTGASAEAEAETAAGEAEISASPEAAPYGEDAAAEQSSDGAEESAGAAAPLSASINSADGTVTYETETGTVLLTPEEIRAALDAGTLDESDAVPADENGFLSWLWNLLFGKKSETYSGWRTVNGKTYYYSSSTHKPLTGIQSIDNKLYYFDADGVQRDVTFGIDVSKYQSSIDFAKAKQAGVQFVIIRIGYRGYGSGTLVQDPLFEQHFTNARNAGLRVGVYFFSQAVNENEAVEEAQAVCYVLNGRQLDYPVYFDSEASGGSNGRADGLGKTDRTKCAVAFCEEVKRWGYRPGVYASTLWFSNRLDLSSLSGYSIWNANYGVASSPISCDLWQGTCTARISGYSGQLDVDISYIG